MGIKFNPGLRSVGIDPGLVDQLVQAEKIPLQKVMKRQDKKKEMKTQFEELSGLIKDLGGKAQEFSTNQGFIKLKVDSSHPDIIDGTVGPQALVGSYEMEVRGLARSEKELAFGYPDKDQSPVGFGYMMIERENGEDIDVVVEPYTTLQGLAEQINGMDVGVKAMVLNTKYHPDPYRLIVVNEASGKEAPIHIDPDTTFLEFQEQVKGKNLDLLFEDVPVTDTDNTLEDIVDGLTLNVRRSEPGTRVQLSVVHDIETTMESLKDFVTKYNSVIDFISKQTTENPETGEMGALSKESTLRSVTRNLQSSLFKMPNSGDKYSSLAQIGISSDPKTGILNLDEVKVKEVLTEDYVNVARLFTSTIDRKGIGEIVSKKIKNLQDPLAGMVTTRIKGLQREIKSQDKDIERKEAQMVEKEKQIRKKFASLEGTLSKLQGQKNFLTAKMGNQAPPTTG